MKFLTKSNVFILLCVLAFWALVFAVYDIVFNKGWMIAILASFALIILLAFIFIFLVFKKDETTIDTIEEFEKSLKGGLFHFKCPSCEGIFAVKKSKSNDDKTIKMTCPDCGVVGIVPKNPKVVEEEIPEKKSIKANFRCNSCGEGVTIWAEGSDLYKNMHVYCCPYCGKEDSMDKI